MDRQTLIDIESEMRGKSGVGVVRRHLQRITHDMLRAELLKRPLVLTEKDRIDG